MAILGTSATPENIAAVEHEWGLDRPYFVQLGEYLVNVFTKFDLGVSYSFKRPVMELIGERIGVTVLLGLLGVAFAVLLGIPLGNHLRHKTVFCLLTMWQQHLQLYWPPSPAFGLR